MRNKIYVMVVLLLSCLMLQGCFSSEETVGTETIIDVVGETIVYSDHTIESEDDDISANVPEKGTDVYYRLSAKTKKIDYSELFVRILGFIGVPGNVIENRTEELTSDGQFIGECVWDGTTYRFNETVYGCFYRNDKERGSVSEEEAIKYANSFMDYLQWDYNEEPELVIKGDDLIEVVYRLEYSDVKMMGNNTLFFTTDEEEIPLQGSFVEFEISEGGIRNISFFPLPEVVEVVEEYEKSHFINRNIVSELVNQYIVQFYDMYSIVADGELEIVAIEIIYMPHKSVDSEIELIPVYEIKTRGIEHDKERERIILMDAVTGYVYDTYIVLQ